MYVSLACKYISTTEILMATVFIHIQFFNIKKELQILTYISLNYLVKYIFDNMNHANAYLWYKHFSTNVRWSQPSQISV